MKKRIVRQLSFFLCLALSSCGYPSSISSIDSVSSSAVSSSILITRGKYSNPLTFLNQAGQEYFVSCADPDVIKGDDGYYYLYCTNTYCEMGNLGMAYDRGPIFRSNDLLSWTWTGSVFQGHNEDGNWGTRGAGVWGPSVIKVGNRYNYYYALSTWGDNNPGIGVATSSTPYGPWTHYGKVLDSKDSGVTNSIDPQAIYLDEQLYLIWGSFYGIACTPLTDDGTEVYYGLDSLKNHIHWLINDNTVDGEMDVNSNYEGSYVFQKDNKYYYLGSQGSCCSGIDSTYRVKAGMSDSMFGPYKGKDGLSLDNKEGTFGELVIGPSKQIAGVGHNTIIQDEEGEFWILYHGYEINSEKPNERTAFIDKLLWDDEGYPYVKGQVASYGADINGPAVIEI